MSYTSNEPVFFPLLLGIAATQADAGLSLNLAYYAVPEALSACDNPKTFMKFCQRDTHSTMQHATMNLVNN